MGLYLCVWDGSEELDGVDVGSYADYGRLVEAIVEHVEGRKRGSKCPTITMHSDSDGLWAIEDCAKLEQNLEEVRRVFSTLPPIAIPEGWQKQVAKTFGVKPVTLAGCFFDVDGEPLIERLIDLCRTGIESKHGILFQ